jgi:hypothetical protein
MDADLQFTMKNARYAKGKVALHIPGVDGWKSTAAMILTIEIAPKCRYSHRENAYIVSRSQAARFVHALWLLKERRLVAPQSPSGPPEGSRKVQTSTKALETP